jgi:hypothetical protein
MNKITMAESSFDRLKASRRHNFLDIQYKCVSAIYSTYCDENYEHF